jgi:hypothetical protein
MKTKLVYLMALFISHFAISQDFFLKGGKNFTKYNYVNSMGKSVSVLEGSNGSNYEIGFEYFLDNADSSLESSFSYSASLILNQFNAKGGDFNNTYVWNTNYLGIQNMAYVSVLMPRNSLYNFKLKAGVNTSTIVSGQQYINNVVYNLKYYDEFKGIFVQPIIGLDFRLEVTHELNLNFGYMFSRAFNVSNKSSEKLSFTNNQLQLGLHYNIN